MKARTSRNGTQKVVREEYAYGMMDDGNENTYLA